MPTSKICDIEPFRYQSTPQPIGVDGASSNQINEQALEDYLHRMRQAVCDDIQSIIDECCNGNGGGGGGGAESFLELDDTPAAYTGAGGDAVLVNGGETGLVFGTPPSGADDDGITLDHSTSEQATLRTWTGAETIYQKTVVSAGNFSTGNTNVAHGITGLGTVICVRALMDRSNGAQIPVPFVSSAAAFTVVLQINATNLIVGVGTGWTGAGNVLSNFRATLFYTKA
ncbi:MAG: hypothetical protein GY906_23495 [bacterium]|nr:hypothetical protein [bacterium]